MTRLPRLLASILLSSSLLACERESTTPPSDGTPPPTTDPGTVDPTPTPDPTGPVAVEPGRNYDLVISFISPGDGTDHEAAKRLEAAIAGFTGVVHATGHWGREGEHDECFVLSGLAEADRASFLDKALASVADSKKVNVSENAPCQDRGAQ